MIDKFKVERFRSIESLEIELGAVNVFIGANGSGKSNLLEAIGVLAAAAYGRVDGESLLRRGCRSGFFYPMFQDFPLDRGTGFEAKSGDVRYAAEFGSPHFNAGSQAWKFTREVLQDGNRVIVERPDPLSQGQGDFQVGLAALKLAELPSNAAAALFLKSLSSYSIYTPDTPVLRGLVQDPQTREPLGLSGGRLAEAIYEINRDSELREDLRRLLSSTVPNIEEYVVLSSPAATATDVKEDSRMIFFLGFVDRFFRKQGNSGYVLGVNEINEGALHFLFVAALCLHPAAPKTVALENIDHGLNPLLAKRFIENICQWLLNGETQRQILMTTQNPLVLDGLPLDDDRVRLFTVDRDNRGATQVKRFQVTDEFRKIAKDKDWPLSRMWVNGLIGGVPNV